MKDILLWSWNEDTAGDRDKKAGKGLKSKYKNIQTQVDGIRFASKREGRRYQDLKLLEKAGVIKGLRLQVPYHIYFNGVMICKYIADFVYQENGKEIVEDVKGMRTQGYRLKKKMMKACYNIDILET